LQRKMIIYNIRWIRGSRRSRRRGLWRRWTWWL